MAGPETPGRHDPDGVRRPGARGGEPGPVASGPWRRLARQLVYENPWITVWHDEVRRPDGQPGIYGVVHFAAAAVGVVAVGDDGRLLLVGQHRYTLDAYSWELPEGGVPPGESLLDGAKRELREETGYTAGTWRELCRVSLSNSVTDEVGAIFLATHLRAGPAQPDGTEDLATRWVTVEEAIGEIDRGVIHDVLTVAGISRYALGTVGPGRVRWLDGPGSAPGRAPADDDRPSSAAREDSAPG